MPLPCAMGKVSPGSTPPEFGVIRGTPGHAEVHSRSAGRVERVLTFRGNTVTSGAEKVRASKLGDMWTNKVNSHERYKVPDSVTSGG